MKNRLEAEQDGNKILIRINAKNVDMAIKIMDLIEIFCINLVRHDLEEEWK
ncbi:hypothetical protein Syn7502_02812 [Synechococcus sp. PCC 7502]|uniref:hypothetical protein n=1 Tax=Synechococcus sp. PCC 7502 TaxID=1173263 RepID=UPI00029FD4BE|nr:hypothetical protein [Synechococcus sp. PCC 7502]AFY74750.1 hypothetical protein Syn7502_02812 [Synechococcus sp. PCC 7502]